MINVTDVKILDNPAKFTDPLRFEIQFECLGELRDDLEWKIIYVGSAENEQHDQVLESILVGPIPVGVNAFVFESNPPNNNLIPAKDLLGVTVILLTCSYKTKEFIRIGYYVNNEYDTQEMRDLPPSPPVIERIIRSILSDKPRVTRFNVPWDN